MKYITRIFFMGVILIIGFHYLVFNTIKTGISETDKYIEESKSLIGEKFVYDNDTLVITNFKYIPTASYYLVGDQEFAVKYVKKNLIK